MLSKSDLLAYRQCPRKLWLLKNRPELVPAENINLDRRAMDGDIVGEKAREALGRDAVWPKGYADKKLAMMKALEQIVSKPGQPIVEMPMVRDGLYVRVDALVPDGEADGYALQETKASTFPLKPNKSVPGEPDKHHLDDVAIQVWVAQNSGLEISRAELNLLDNQWRYPGKGDYSGLFRPMVVDEKIANLVPDVPQWLEDCERIVASEAMPEIHTGPQCKDPYECPFKDFCVKHEPAPEEHPIELLPDSAGKGLAKKLRINKGYTSLLQPAPEELVGAQAELYRRIQEAHRTGAAVMVPGAQEYLDSLPYPRYYFDFEGIDLPVPRWEGVRPYEQVPFQWSCHIERSPGVFEHHSFLDLTGDDPSLPCVNRMLEVIDPDCVGPIFVYYKPYEKGRLEELAIRHPQHEAAMAKYIARLVDLLPVVKNHFYHPDMKGSFSIKKVLPVIAPDLDYSTLEGVQEGTGAQVAYLHACFNADSTQAIRENIRKNLLKYCDQDTWAMVEVAYFMAGRVRPQGLRPPSQGV
jgi:CRISPR/Cas system-associated exonuclease Cas4 (RecB family)